MNRAMVSWQKQGLIFVPAGDAEWNQSHASVPTVDTGGGDTWRIYYATRDGHNRARIGYFDVAAADPSRVLYVHPEPILELGQLGTFDDCGMMPSWILTVGGRKYLYYIGWTTRQSVPFHNSIGLLVSDDDGATFQRFAEGPLFGPTYKEPHFTGTSCVIRQDDLWRNYYLSCTKWEVVHGRPEPFYHLKYAESHNGIDWERRGAVAIDFKSEREAGIVRASVLPSDDGWRMWYCYRTVDHYRTDRSQSYRIGFAVSDDGVRWQRRDDEAGILPSESGWDSDMQAYPQVVPAQGNLVMFYNGNGFGRSGIGFATAKEAP